MNDGLVLRGIRIPSPQQFVDVYLSKVILGTAYYRLPLVGSKDSVGVEDLGAAVLFMGRPQSGAAFSLIEPLSLEDVPSEPLHMLDDDAVAMVADKVLDLAQRRGFGPALATKVLHKKRSATIPVIDNKAILGTYASTVWNGWQNKRRWASADVREVFRLIREDMSRPDNEDALIALEHANVEFTRIELFDMIWWAALNPATDLAEWRRAALGHELSPVGDPQEA